MIKMLQLLRYNIFNNNRETLQNLGYKRFKIKKKKKKKKSGITVLTLP